MDQIMTTSDVIALGALAVSIYTIISSEVKSRKNDREQKVIKDEQDRLRKLLLEKETKSAINEMKAELGVRLVNIARNNYRQRFTTEVKSKLGMLKLFFLIMMAMSILQYRMCKTNSHMRYCIHNMELRSLQ